MTPPAKGKIFLSDERGCIESDWFRSYRTFNYGKYQHEHKQPFGELQVLNDDTLAGGRSFKVFVEENTCIVLLPVVGAVSCTYAAGKEEIVHAGELLIMHLEQHAALEISNPFEHELVNFIQLRMKPSAFPSGEISRICHFNLDAHKDNLIPVTSGADLYPRIAIGKFAGRKEAVHKATGPQQGLFAFVIQGAFEVQGRLLHARDGLGLWDDPDDTELEALSNDAIILLVETGKV